MHLCPCSSPHLSHRVEFSGFVSPHPPPPSITFSTDVLTILGITDASENGYLAGEFLIAVIADRYDAAGGERWVSYGTAGKSFAFVNKRNDHLRTNLLIREGCTGTCRSPFDHISFSVRGGCSSEEVNRQQHKSHLTFNSITGANNELGAEATMLQFLWSNQSLSSIKHPGCRQHEPNITM